MFWDFINLFFPHNCLVCKETLHSSEETVCLKCLSDMPFTNFENIADNEMEKHLWGRVNCNAAMSLLFFRKSGHVQKVIHNLKYKQQTQVGIEFGRMIGKRIQASDRFKGIDFIIPVPLHPKKERIRGFNQSLCICEGIAKSMKIKVDTNHLKRELFTETQTKKKNFERYQNTKDAFVVKKAEEFEGLHILLVDDVFTTGATIESCVNALKNKVKEIKVSVATLALASH